MPGTQVTEPPPSSGRNLQGSARENYTRVAGINSSRFNPATPGTAIATCLTASNSPISVTLPRIETCPFFALVSTSRCEVLGLTARAARTRLATARSSNSVWHSGVS
jgi:hypothetical protein